MIGIVWCVIGIDEVKVKPSQGEDINHDSNELAAKSKNGLENPAFVTDGNDVNRASSNNNNSGTNGKTEASKDVVKKNFFIEFFDPTLALACIAVFMKERQNRGRLILFLLIGAYFIGIAPAFGEGDYIYLFARKKLNWEGVKFSHFITYNTFAVLVGKILKIKINLKVCS